MRYTQKYKCLPSSLIIVILALSCVMETVPVPVLLSLPKKVSVDSTALSLMIGTVTVVDVSPGVKTTGMELLRV